MNDNDDYRHRLRQKESNISLVVLPSNTEKMRFMLNVNKQYGCHISTINYALI